MTSVLAFIIVIGILIVIHELGHFVVARLFGVGVERFSIGFGPVLWRYRGKETEYCLSAIPMGGYVKMMGDDENPIEAPSFEAKAKLLRSVRPLDAGSLVRGQYRGYRSEQGVAPDSRVETFAAMRLDNFVVRPHRRSVEKYAKPEAWLVLSAEALNELAHEVAGGKWVVTGGGGYSVIDVVPRAWAHLLAIASGNPIEPTVPTPDMISKCRSSGHRTTAAWRYQRSRVMPALPV